MRFDIISLFPTLFDIATYGVVGRAFKQGKAQLKLWNPRDFTEDRHRTVDDRPYGGGPGMVMMAEPLARAIKAAKQEVPQSPVIYLSPQGKRFDQRAAVQMSQGSGLILLAGRYEGIDERLIECCIDEQWSIGDFVLSGGELAALVIMDAIIRLLPDVLGDQQSAQQDSYMNGRLDHPHYTRPENFQGLKVPAVLTSGNHAAIERWRLKQSLGRTWLYRPDLIAAKELTPEEWSLLKEFMQEYRCEAAKIEDYNHE